MTADKYNKRATNDTQISQVCSENAVHITCRHKSYELRESFLREKNVTKTLSIQA